MIFAATSSLRVFSSLLAELGVHNCGIFLVGLFICWICCFVFLIFLKEEFLCNDYQEICILDTALLQEKIKKTNPTIQEHLPPQLRNWEAAV